MAVTYGFYDSLNHDRLYNAKQMSAIFDGIINDGVFDSVGNQLHTVAGSGMQVIVKSGRAWFNSTWTLNDAEYPLTIDAADVLLTRIDAVVIEVNSEQATRANSIKVVKGTPASSPAKPTLTNTSTVHQHALAYVTIAKNTTAITNSMIEIVVGKTETPYVTAILQTTDITDLYKNWEDYFQTWFDTVRGTLDGDVALNLQNQITSLERSILKSDTKTAMGLSSDAVGDDAFKYLLNNDIARYRYIEFLESTTWSAPSNIQNNKVKVLCCGGGGGGGSSGGGGGSGYITISDITIEPGKTYTIVIGSGGSGAAGNSGGNGSNGGTTIFGNNLVIASGGGGGVTGYDSGSGDGGDGNAGGGSHNRNGGNGGKYGGGGGGYVKGGNGGKYGGGGGCYSSGGGGQGGAYGANGNAGADTDTNASNGKTLDISDLLFPYLLNKNAIGGYNNVYGSANHGGGGGGFGGNGGNGNGGGGGFGGNGGSYYGGGGGFGGNGGNGGYGNNADNWYTAGGGGGYFGDGGGYYDRTLTHGERGGGGSGSSAWRYSATNGGSGVCALMYYVNDSGGFYE